ncbi:hypothetical protein CPB86DRAFT_389105 [Serendipita vermifera]|nr:hypothetical protein CPB86DRAFT_389105 [Serendipita vermifera]
MGIFDFVGNALGSVFKDVEHVIGSDFKFTPGGILKEVGNLIPMISDAVPVVGPLIGEAVGAATTIFGSPAPPANPEQGGTSNAIVFKEIHEIQDLITSSNNAVKGAIAAVQSSVDALRKQLPVSEVLGHCEAKLRPSIQYMDNNLTSIEKLTPFYGPQEFQEYVTLPQTVTTPLMIRRNDLFSVVAELQSFLGDHRDGVGSQQILDLYLLAVIWLLMYDKMILTLYAYLAQSYLSTKEIDSYISSIDAWNNRLRDTRQDAHGAVEFLLGTHNKGGSFANGFIDKLQSYALKPSAELYKVTIVPGSLVMAGILPQLVMLGKSLMIRPGSG